MDKFLSKIIEFPVDSLLLDIENPRLPENFIDRTQEGILKYLWENDSLSELIESYVQNGFFPTEPLITLPEDSGTRVVVEGNRRLAALLILLETDRYKSAKIHKYKKNENVTKELIDSLTNIPIAETPSRDSLTSYLGFRHVSGLRQWGAAEKARWIYEQIKSIETVSSKGEDREFYNLGRKIGSNAAGVKNSYCAYALLLHCRDNLDANIEKIDYILKDRFTVWQRIIYNSTISKIINLELSNLYSLNAINSAISSVNAEKILEVISDIFPEGDEPAIVSDSRNIQKYSKVLADQAALEVLRRTRNLYFAEKIADKSNINPVASIRELKEQVKNTSKSLNESTKAGYLEGEEGNSSLTKEHHDALKIEMIELKKEFRYLISDIEEIINEESL